MTLQLLELRVKIKFQVLQQQSGVLNIRRLSLFSPFVLQIQNTLGALDVRSRETEMEKGGKAGF
jgi:hypothetical protein